MKIKDQNDRCGHTKVQFFVMYKRSYMTDLYSKINRLLPKSFLVHQLFARSRAFQGTKKATISTQLHIFSCKKALMDFSRIFIIVNLCKKCKMRHTFYACPRNCC